MFRSSILILSILLCPVLLQADVPSQINHQGVVSVNGSPFEGTGLFRFAVVDNDAGANLWTNDGTIVGAVGGIPTAAVSLSVVKGVYSVSLGDTTLTNMTAVASSVFNSANTVLRIWFDDGVNGLQQLTPDLKLTTTPYSFRLPNIHVDENGSVGIGTDNPVGELHITAPSDESALVVLETTGPSPTTGAIMRFYRSGVSQKGIGVNGENDFELWQGSGSNDSVANRRFFRMHNDTGNTTFGGDIGIGVDPPVKTLHVRGTGLYVEGYYAGQNYSVVDIGSAEDDDGAVQLLTLDVDIDNNGGGRRTYFNVSSVGDVTGKYGNYHVASDKRLKRDIVTIPNALKRVLSLRGVNFKWKDASFDGDTLQMGLISQEVESVFPEVVHTANDKMKTKAVEYEFLVGALVEAIKELDSKVNELNGVVTQKDSELTSQRNTIKSFESRLAAIEARLPKVASADRGE